MSQKHITPHGADESARDDAALICDGAMSQATSVNRGDS
jgi:hypothetical protein